MKYNVKVGEKTFEVEVEDINKRPVIARVDGEVFEVSLERRATAQESQPAVAPKPVEKRHIAAAAPSSMNLSGSSLVAPLPGIVVEVFIKPGEAVETGQVILVIEAMKMKNSIRSVRDGIVKQVLVSAGQTVAHKQVLVEFAA
jgi:glutaconyl-CoA/methylmalonyl-CoA decarboxylase subunit gamma